MNNIIFEGRLHELLQNYRHIHNVTSPGTGTDNSNRTAVKKEIETVNEWQLGGSEGEVEVCVATVCLLRGTLDVLHHIDSNVRYAWKYKGSDC